MKRNVWTPEQDAIVRKRYADESTATIAASLRLGMTQVYARAHHLGLHKSAAYQASVKSGRIQRGKQHPSMVAHQFQPGLVPWNKGTHFSAGGRSPLTRFKPGTRGGVAAQKWMPIGSHRLNGAGYLDRKITDDGRGPRDWDGEHRQVWIAAHGPIPAGHVITFLPGRRTTVLELITLDALECISRAELGRRNHPRNKSPELGRLVQLKGAITRQVNRITNEAAQAEEQTA